MTQEISIVAAMSRNRVIGNKGDIPWKGKMPADMRHFRTLTLGQNVVMGRKTYESIGNPLKGRRNIIISNQADLIIHGCFVVHSLWDAIDIARKESSQAIMIIGGETVYESALIYANRIYLTLINTTVDGDTFFPTISEQEWKEVSRQEFDADQGNHFPYAFLEYKRL